MPTYWQTYFEHTKDRPPRRLLVKALGFVKEKGAALDLGAGALNDTIYLLQEGFARVTALDAEPVAQRIADELPPERFDYVVAPFHAFGFPENVYTLVNAQFALPFATPGTFDDIFSKIIRSLKPRGIFTGQFFGERDEWNVPERHMTFHTRKQAKKLLSGLEILHFEEEEKDERTAAAGMKHRHVFHFIAKRRQ